MKFDVRSVHPLIKLRWILARHRWIRWLAIATSSLVAGLGVQSRVAALDAARAEWDGGVLVFVLRHPVAAGDEISASDADRRFAPPDLVPSGAVNAIDQPVIARHALGAGEILSDTDIGRAHGPAGLLTADTVGVSIATQPGLSPPVVVGDRVGLVLVDDPIGFDAAETVTDSLDGSHGLWTEGVVLAVSDEDSVLIAVAADRASRVVGAAAQGRISLVLQGMTAPYAVRSDE